MLKAHQKRPVKLFEDYLADNHVELITPYWTARFLLEVCHNMPLPLRQATWNALTQIYGPPFQARPMPYPLLTRYLEEDFETLWDRYKDHAPTALLLIGVDADVIRKRSYTLKRLLGVEMGGVIKFDKRTIPITEHVYQLAQSPFKGQPLVSAAVAHNALHEYLIRNKVPEVTRASIYGRWSAMKLQRATDLLGYFKVKLDGSISGE